MQDELAFEQPTSLTAATAVEPIAQLAYGRIRVGC